MNGSDTGDSHFSKRSSDKQTTSCPAQRRCSDHRDARTRLGCRWLNAWLASIGVVMLVDGITLRWSDDPRPHAIFDSPSDEAIAEQIEAALPELEDLERLTITRSLQNNSVPFSRRIDRVAFASRASSARDLGDFTLGSTLTDLGRNRIDDLDHSPFDPPVPKGLTLADRVVAIRRALPESAATTIASSMKGTAERVKLNGLGFDYRRVLQGADPVGDKWVDPTVELLAFSAPRFFLSRRRSPLDRTRLDRSEITPTSIHLACLAPSARRRRHRRDP